MERLDGHAADRHAGRLQGWRYGPVGAMAGGIRRPDRSASVTIWGWPPATDGVARLMAARLWSAGGSRDTGVLGNPLHRHRILADEIYSNG